MTKRVPPSHLETLWSGRLRNPADPSAGAPGLKVRIGRPLIWPAATGQPQGWRPPQGLGTCYVVKLAYTLNPPPGMHVHMVNFRLRLHPQGRAQAIVLDAQPQSVLVEEKREVRVSVGPELQLGLVGVGATLAEGSVDLGRLRPVVRLYGLQEDTCTWRYESHPRYPLSGSRTMLAVVALPTGVERILADVQLDAVLHANFGRFGCALPPDEAAQLRFNIGADNRT